METNLSDAGLEDLARQAATGDVEAMTELRLRGLQAQISRLHDQVQNLKAERTFLHARVDNLEANVYGA